MNVKSLSNSISIAESSQNVRETPKAVKSESSSKDKDADGRRHQDDNQQRRPMDEEQFQQALLKLKEKDGIKDNGLLVEGQMAGETKIAVIKDHLGKVVRRVPEYELWSLLESPDQTTGNLYNKAM